MVHNIFAKTPKHPDDFHPFKVAERAALPNGQPDPRNWSAMVSAISKLVKGEGQ